MSLHQSTHARWTKTEQRLRIMEGRWRFDVRHRIRQFFLADKAAVLGRPSTAVNIMKSTIVQTAVLYTTDPQVSQPDWNDEQAAYFATIHVWDFHQRIERLTQATGEMAVHTSWSVGHHAADPGIRVRPVTTNFIDAEDDPKAPGVPVVIKEKTRRFDKAENKWIDVWDVWSIKDPKKPFFAVLDREDGKNITNRMIDDEDPAKWRWFHEGVPYLPWVLYHAELQNRLWNPDINHELVELTLDTAVKVTGFGHICRDASWRQKYGLDVEIQGLEQSQQGGGDRAIRSEVATDVSSIILFRSKEGKTGSLGTFEAPISPLEYIEAIREFVKMGAANVGFDPSDTEKKDRESGISIVLRRDAVRRFRSNFIKPFRRADELLLSVIAKVSNGFSDKSVPALPVDGYVITYAQMPLTSEERIQRHDGLKSDLELNLISEVDILLERDPSLNRKTALAKLMERRLERRTLGTLPA